MRIKTEVLTDEAETTYGTLCDYRTGDSIRAATADEQAESIAAAERDGGRGVIVVDGRAVYVDA